MLSQNYIFNSVAMSQTVGLIISCVVLFFSVRESDKPVLKYYSLSVAFKCVYLFALIMQSMAVPVELKVFWADIKTSAGLFSPYLWLLVTIIFTLKKLPSRSILILMFTVPVASVLVIYTDAYFHIYRISTALVHGHGTYYQLVPKFGMWFYAVVTPSLFVPILISIYLFAYAFFTSGKYGRLPYGLLLCLTIISALLVAPVFSQSVIFDTYGTLFPVGLLLNFLVLKKYSFLDMIPMAKQTALDIIDSAVFTYDLKGKLVDVNKAGENLKGVLPAFNAYTLCGFFTGKELAEPEPQKLMTAKADDRCYSAVFYSVMRDNNTREGYVALVNDITENIKMAEVEKEKEIVYQKGLIISDIHDSISGSVSIIGMIAENMLDSGDMDAESVNRIRMIAGDTHKEVRFMMNTYERQNATYDEMSRDLRHIGNLMTEDNGMSFSLDEKIDDSIMQNAVPFGIYVNIIRFFKECVVNAVRHSCASVLNAAINVSGGDIVIEVSDNGCGFSPSAKKGRGLKNMVRRIEMIGGSLSIDSGNGTKIVCRIPIKE